MRRKRPAALTLDVFSKGTQRGRQFLECSTPVELWRRALAVHRRVICIVRALFSARTNLVGEADLQRADESSTGVEHSRNWRPRRVPCGNTLASARGIRLAFTNSHCRQITQAAYFAQTSSDSIHSTLRRYSAADCKAFGTRNMRDIT